MFRLWRRSLLGGIRFLLIWLLASFAWMTVLGAGLCLKVDDQIAASSELAHDLALLNCEGSRAGASSCAAPDGAVAAGTLSYGGTWREVIETFLCYGFDYFAPLLFGPPAAVLLVGAGIVLFLRRERGPRPRVAVLRR